MYYTNIKDYEQIQRERKDASSVNGVVLAIVIGLVVLLFI